MILSSLEREEKDALHWNVKETQGGAKMVATADNKPALDTLLKFQSEDHKTGDCEVPH